MKGGVRTAPSRNKVRRVLRMKAYKCHNFRWHWTTLHFSNAELEWSKKELIKGREKKEESRNSGTYAARCGGGNKYKVASHDIN